MSANPNPKSNLIDTFLTGYDLVMDHVESNSEIEQVGLLLTSGRVIELENEIQSPSGFRVGMRQMADALATIDPHIESVAAMYHSHPGGSLEPSATDSNSMVLQWGEGVVLPWIIIDPDTGLYRIWVAHRGRVVEYRSLRHAG